MADIPDWAELVQPATDHRIAVYEVDPDKAYPILFDAVKEGIRASLLRVGDLPHRDAVAVINAVQGLRPEFDKNIEPGNLGEFASEALKKIDGMALDEYWYEVCYQCIKLEMQRTLGTFQFEIRIRGGKGYKSRWAMKGLPEGRGLMAATKGWEAKVMHERFTGGAQPKPGNEAKGLFSRMLRK